VIFGVGLALLDHGGNVFVPTAVCGDLDELQLLDIS
jgi:hypothetical protein